MESPGSRERSSPRLRIAHPAEKELMTIGGAEPLSSSRPAAREPRTSCRDMRRTFGFERALLTWAEAKGW